MSDFFQNGGTQAVVVRITGTPKVATSEADNSEAEDSETEDSETEESTAVPAVSSAWATSGLLTLEASSPGAWANESYQYVTRTPSAVSDPVPGSFDLWVGDAAGTVIEQFTNLSWNHGERRDAMTTLARESALVRVRELGKPASVHSLGTPALGANPFELPAEEPAADNGGSNAEPGASNGGSAGDGGAGDGGEARDEGDGAPASAGDREQSTADGDADGGAGDEVATSEPAVLANGTDGPPPGDADYEGSEDSKTGWYALTADTVDLFNLLVLPPPRFDIDQSDAVWPKAAVFCKSHRAFLLVDPKAVWDSATTTLTDIASEAGGLISEADDHAAIYFPRIRRADQHGDDREFGPSGSVAGIMARTDAQRGVWKAPAGLDASIVGVRELTRVLNDRENGLLNPKGVNVIRPRPAAGRVVWGARTMDGDDVEASQWKYIPVRRTALFIEESLYRGTQWAVFEPNDEPLWSSLRLNIGAFMHRLFRQGAFQGTKPSDAYLVKVDAENNPQADIDLGIVNILVGFAPLKPAEFVIIRVQQLAGQTQI